MNIQAVATANKYATIALISIIAMLIALNVWFGYTEAHNPVSDKTLALLLCFDASAKTLACIALAVWILTAAVKKTVKAP